MRILTQYVINVISKHQVQIDTSHFFWLVTYFLKFAAQLELDLEHIKCVLSFNIISYLTYEGVNLYEQLELASRQQGVDIKPCLRRMHLVSYRHSMNTLKLCFMIDINLSHTQVVTAIREFLQALDTYKKITHHSQVSKGVRRAIDSMLNQHIEFNNFRMT